MNLFYNPLVFGVKNEPSLKSKAYENLKDQEKLMLQEQKIVKPSVVWKSHRSHSLKKRTKR